MISSVQSIQNNQINLNKAVFGSDQYSQPSVSTDYPNDKFEKKGKNAIRNGAIAGALTHIIWDGIAIINAGGFSKATENASEEISKIFEKNIKLTKTQYSACLAAGFAIMTTIGAGLGAAYKHFTKKD